MFIFFAGELKMIVVVYLPEFLLALQRVLELVKGLLQLSLDLVQVVDFVFGGLEVFGGLLVDFLHVLLLLVELVDELILVGDLVVQVADLVVLGGLVGLGLEYHPFEI
jgi:hypothetical protein